MVRYKPKNVRGFVCVNLCVQRALGKVISKARARARSADWYEQNKERAIGKRLERYEQNKESEKEKMKEYAKSFTPKQLEDRKVYRENHKIERSEYCKKRRREDDLFLLTERARGMINKLKKRKQGHRNGRTFEMLGTTAEELLDRLVALNNGESIQHCECDHIFPLAKYKNTKDKEKKMLHFSNLQPLPGNANLDKRDKLPTKAMAARVERWAWPDGVTEDMLPDIYPGWSTPLRM